MKRLAAVGLAILVLATSHQAVAGPQEVSELLKYQREHGFVAPTVAADALKKASDGMEAAPVELRAIYHNQLAVLYLSAEDHVSLQTHLDALDRMAKEEKCVPCGHYRTTRMVHQAVRRQDFTKARSLLDGLGQVDANNKTLLQSVQYTRATVLEGEGNHARAIEEAMAATKLAIELNAPAEQARALNMMLLSNVARGDLDRAMALAKEAYALAERIGFIYMMAYVRGNEGWV